MQVYLDNSATTQPFPRVVAVMREAMETGGIIPPHSISLPWRRKSA